MTANRSKPKQPWKRGGALLGVVVLLPFLLLGVAASSRRALTELDAARGENRRAKALYIAHAGLQEAVSRLIANTSYRGEEKVVPFGGGMYSSRVEGSEVYPELEDRVLVSVDGIFPDPVMGNIERRLEVIVRASVEEYPDLLTYWPELMLYQMGLISRATFERTAMAIAYFGDRNPLDVMDELTNPTQADIEMICWVEK